MLIASSCVAVAGDAAAVVPAAAARHPGAHHAGLETRPVGLAPPGIHPGASDTPPPGIHPGTHQPRPDIHPYCCIRLPVEPDIPDNLSSADIHLPPAADIHRMSCKKN